MIRALNSETDPQQLLESILEMALRTVGAERSMILLREPESGELRISAATHLEPETERDALEYSRGIVDQAAGGKSLLAVDAQEDGRFRDLRSVSLFGIRSMMCVPLRAHGTLIGTVYLDSRQGRTPFTQQDLQFLEAFADHAAVALQNANRLDALTRENRQLAHQAEERTHFAGMVGKSAEIQRVFDLMDTLAPSSLPVLIEGESGTGKELVARALHGLGPRRRRVFLSENCAALPDSLLERELFGHEKGAFSGAERSMPGLFENAHEGTLFLDEIGETSLAMQAKLLRVLNENEVRRLGGTGTLKVNVRVLAATNRNLEQEVRAGRFRQDLLFRLKVLVVKLPPLRERHGDVALLVQHFVRRVAEEAGRSIPEIDPELLQAMEQYGWPGNIRQLHNVIQRLFVLGDGLSLSLDTVKADPELRTMLGGERTNAPVSLLNSEREQIQRALIASGGNRLRAAEMLGISKATIYRKIQRYGLS
ncbi:hypothetical protein ABI59_21510 [Acidobacteria bacterium Mor1]|nr:hypothetical protein ABI59_21510 [Acidobacteria bacterium Mor1]